MKATFKPTQGLIRFYKGGSYEENTPYVGVVNVIFLSDTIAVLAGMHGRFGREGIKALAVELQQLGIKTVLADRHGSPVTYHLEDFK